MDAPETITLPANEWPDVRWELVRRWRRGDTTQRTPEFLCFRRIDQDRGLCRIPGNLPRQEQEVYPVPVTFRTVEQAELVRGVIAELAA